MGGEFIALYELYSETRTEYEAQKAALSGRVGIWSSSVEASQSFSEISNFRSVSLKISRLGPTDALPATPEGIIEYATLFPTKLTPENAATLFFSTQSYARAAEGVESIDFVPALTALSNAVDARDRRRSLRRDWEQVKNYPEWFGGAPSAALAEQRIAAINNELQQISAYIGEVQRKPFEKRQELTLDEQTGADVPAIAVGDNLPLSVTLTNFIIMGPTTPSIGSNGQWVGQG